MASKRVLTGATVTLAVVALGIGLFRFFPERMTKNGARVAVPRTSQAAPAPSAPTPPRVPVRASREAKVEQVFRAPWGGRKGELGRKAADESSPEGPMAFAVDGSGRSYVLDQVNGRVAVFESGREPRSIPVPADTFQDVALTKSGGLALLDRLKDGTVAFTDASGRVSHEVAIAGEGIQDAGDVTGLFQRDDGTWLEVSHANLVKVADADGAPLDDRVIVQGRFGGTDRVLRASRSGDRAAFVAERNARGVSPLSKVSFDLPLRELLELDVDPKGNVVLAASLLEEGPAPNFDVLDAREVVVLLDPRGAELARVELPASVGPEESFRRIRVGADGAIYHLGFEESGAIMRRIWL